jgi:hypothetical protein
VISSRTPEGEWNRCPVCQNEVRVEPSQVFGDATCPVCGSLLWFFAAGSAARLFGHDEGERMEIRLRAMVAERLGINPDAVRDGDWQELGIDSLDLVELVMELEEEA